MVFEFIILLFIKFIDLPLLENNPFFWWWVSKPQILLLKSKQDDPKVFTESYLFSYEFFYSDLIAFYEYKMIMLLGHNTILFTSTFPSNKKFVNTLVRISIVFTMLHMWWFNLFFIIAIILLPVVFWSFFWFVDWYEQFEELWDYIQKKIV